MELRELPFHEIDGTPFYVDLEREEFRQVDNDANRISFKRLGCHRHGYVLLFDSLTKNAWIGPKGKEPPHVKAIFIPFKSKLDPVGLARQQGFPDDYYT